jgi:hypothetical protein
MRDESLSRMIHTNYTSDEVAITSLCKPAIFARRGVCLRKMTDPVMDATAFFTDRSIENGMADAIPPFARRDHPQIY